MVGICNIFLFAICCFILHSNLSKIKNLQAEQALSFAVGIAAANYEKIKQIQKTKLFILGLVLIIIGISFLAIKQMPSSRVLNHYIITLFNLIIKEFAAIGVVFLSHLFSKVLRFLIAFGKISFELYLVHGYFMFIISQSLFKGFVLNVIVFLVVVFVTTLVFNKVNVYTKKFLGEV